MEEFPIFKDGVEVGEILIREVGHDNLGYIEWHIEEAERGKGLAAPAVERVIRLAFESGRYHRLVAVIRPSNFASIRVAEKARMRFEGTAVRSRLIDGAWEDTLFYAITAEEIRRSTT
jgi:ribosomal-protein-alanine N-acetyltransferase